MSPRSAVHLVVALAVACGVEMPATAEEPAQVSDLLYAGRDEVLRSAAIPSERNPHGAFRTLRRGDATCAQTLLYTTSLRRAVQRIRKKEQRYWPEGAPGSKDSAAYLDALEQAKEAVLARHTGQRGDRQTLAIEFILAPRSALIAIYDLEVQSGDSDLAIVSMQPIVVRRASADYVRRAMTLMEQSAFDRSMRTGEDEP